MLFKIPLGRAKGGLIDTAQISVIRRPPLGAVIAAEHGPRFAHTKYGSRTVFSVSPGSASEEEVTAMVLRIAELKASAGQKAVILPGYMLVMPDLVKSVLPTMDGDAEAGVTLADAQGFALAFIACLPADYEKTIDKISELIQQAGTTVRTT
jgi:hypothetical protein